MTKNKNIISSNGYGTKTYGGFITVLFVFLLSLGIAIFCYKVSQFDLAMFFWLPLAIVYGILSIVSLIFMFIEAID